MILQSPRKTEITRTQAVVDALVNTVDWTVVRKPRRRDLRSRVCSSRRQTPTTACNFWFQQQRNATTSNISDIL